jgi:hypothetical protein
LLCKKLGARIAAAAISLARNAKKSIGNSDDDQGNAHIFKE